MTDVAGDEWEAALIARTNGVNTEDPDSEEEEPAEEVVVMSTKQAVSQMRNILAFARRSADVGMIDMPPNSRAWWRTMRLGRLVPLSTESEAAIKM